MKILAKKKIRVKMMIAQNNVLFFNKKRNLKLKIFETIKKDNHVILNRILFNQY